MLDLPKKLQQKLSDRTDNGKLRNLSKGENLIDLSSNDYLGFAHNATIYAQTFQYLLIKNLSQNGASGSRLISGNHQLYADLEQYLIEFHQVESALVFNSGYDANIGFFSSVPQRNDLVFYDELIHASIRDGIAMGNAKGYKFKHNSLVDLKEKIKLSVRAQSRTMDVNIYIVTESVFSMDGDSPDLKQLCEFCTEYGYYLVVDEAHAIGVFGTKGEGLLQELNLEEQVFARIITFGKAMGVHGAALLGSPSLKAYLLNFARSFIYTTGLPPHTIATVFSAYKFLESSPGIEQQKNLKSNIEFFNSKCISLSLESFFIPSTSAIQSCIISGNDKVKAISKKLADAGFGVKAILSPTVKEGEERLRFCLHSFNSKEDIGFALQMLKKYLK
ncbi:pyridoxal phosphate-dependent aminotransferase family protein [bacterium]|nr:pyridoxal phosphate-dependent aminotransferase family protein [bacterium]